MEVFVNLTFCDTGLDKFGGVPKQHLHMLGIF